MKSAIKIISGFIAVVVLSAMLAYSVAGLNVTEVKNFGIKERGLTFEHLCWKENSSASGYRIYQKNKNSTQYTLIKTIDKSSITDYKVENLDMESYYTFKISAYKSFFGYQKESKQSAPVETFTLPKGENISSVTNDVKSALTVNWSSGINCTGYEIEFALNSDFSDAQIVEIDERSTITYDIKNLIQGNTYYLRLRSYTLFEGVKYYSDYSKSVSATVKKETKKVAVVKGKPVVSLTFDDGPDYAGASKRILDVLEKYKVKATFFAVGENVKNNPENIKRKVKLGCEIGNHTFKHNHYGNNVNASDISKCSDIIEKITGSRPTVFRSTGGNTTQTIRNECKKEGMSLYYWSIDTKDWKTKNAKKTMKKAMSAKDGDIILMHDIYS
ncbi:MAG: polysaccharide deacetylase family protein, partial [Clostridia bacterium]|nr:polysaccharide deacetylase family protein [Clostridia bacterium]